MADPKGAGVAGKAEAPKYALYENERRFLAHPPDALIGPASPHWQIDDLYVEGSRLRLRSARHSETGETVFKFCRKYEGNDPFSGAITNLYLTSGEHALLDRLPGKRLAKRRFPVEIEGQRFGIDCFSGPLDGLIMVEAEAPSREALFALAFPAWALKEVTEDPRFSGGSLVHMERSDLAEALASHGFPLSGSS